jgi:hypothetical protein
MEKRYDEMEWVLNLILVANVKESIAGPDEITQLVLALV